MGQESLKCFLHLSPSRGGREIYGNRKSRPLDAPVSGLRRVRRFLPLLFDIHAQRRRVGWEVWYTGAGDEHLV